MEEKKETGPGGEEAPRRVLGAGHVSRTAWQQKAGPRGNPGSPEPFPANAEAEEGLLQFRSY